MKTGNTILTAPEVTDVTGVFEKAKLLPGYELLTIDRLYSILTTPGVERDMLLNKLNPTPLVSENIIRQQFGL